jgi:hypothetical protein
MKFKRQRNFAKIFSRTLESNMKSSRADPSLSAVMAKALAMVESEVMETEPRIDQTLMVGTRLPVTEDTTTHLLPTLLADL